MKRRGCVITEPITRKRSFIAYEREEELPFKLRMLRNWKLAPEVAKYLAKSAAVEKKEVDDRSLSQLSVVVYRPNVYQFVIDAVGKRQAQEESFCAMEVEEN